MKDSNKSKKAFLFSSKVPQLIIIGIILTIIITLFVSGCSLDSSIASSNTQNANNNQKTSQTIESTSITTESTNTTISSNNKDSGTIQMFIIQIKMANILSVKQEFFREAASM